MLKRYRQIINKFWFGMTLVTTEFKDLINRTNVINSTDGTNLKS